MNYLSIKNWAADDQPREKLLAHGSRILSDSELIAILLGTGTRDISAVELAKKLLQAHNNNLSSLGKASFADLKKIKGIGEAKAVTILAALEIARRHRESDLPEIEKITSSRDVFDLMKPLLSDIPHEEFWVVYLNRANKVTEKLRISQGGISGTVTDVRIILKKGIEILASSLVLCHNHPSGNLTPSDADKEITTKIKNAALQVDIKLLDHLIVAGKGYYSFADEGLL